MAKGKKSGSAGRFGARYGLRVRRRISEIESRQHAHHACPNCRTGRLKRESTGVWQCRKCDHKFAGGAYVPFTTGYKTIEVASVPTIDEETEIEGQVPDLEPED